jgi:hypothetical protein
MCCLTGILLEKPLLSMVFADFGRATSLKSRGLRYQGRENYAESLSATKIDV